LPVVNISPFWQLAISGSAILIAVAFNSRAGRNKGRIILKEAEGAQ
jgi:rhamnose transport system permease protein